MNRIVVFVRVAALLLAVTAVSPAQVTQPAWLYGSANQEQAHALVEGVDPGYCLAGWVRRPNSDGLVIKTGPGGAPQWSRIVGSPYVDDEAYSMVRTTDNCYCVAGWTDTPYGVHDFFALKLDFAGNQVWGWAYLGLQPDEAYSIIETSDGGYAICGLTYTFGPPPHPNIYLIKLSNAGMPQWARVYWASNNLADEAYSLVQTPDSGYVLVGRFIPSPEPPFFRPFVMKVDATGSFQWVNTVTGIEAADEAFSVALDTGGDILVAGHTWSYGTSPGVTSDLFVARFTPSGVPVWSWTYGWPGGDEHVLDDRSLVATADGGCAVCGPTTSVGLGLPNPNYLILKLDAAGQQQWCRSHPSAYDPGLALSDVPLPMIERAGGGYAVAGWTDSYPYKLGGGDDCHMVTLDRNGNRVVCVDPQVPEQGEMPWVPFDMFGEEAYPEIETLVSLPWEVAFDSMCYDTMPSGVRGTRPGTGPARGFRVEAAPGRVALVLGRDARVAVRVFSPDGRMVASLADRQFGAGRHELALGHGLAPGAYVIRASSGNETVSVKAVSY